MDYLNGKIYRIINSDNLSYYGSTTQTLETRFIKHKSAYNVWLKGKSKNYCSSYEVLKGNHVEIELVWDCPCNSRKELLECEQVFIENENCVNKSKSFMSEEQKKEYRAQFYKIYNANKKEQIKRFNKKYYELNRERLNKARTEYNLRKKAEKQNDVVTI